MVGITLSDKGAKFEAELEELLKIVEILKDQLRKKHRKELKKLLEEINKIYEIIVKTSVAFYDIATDDPQFSKLFAAKLKLFKEQYSLDRETVGFRCDEVKRQLDKLTEPAGPSIWDKLLRRPSDPDQAIIVSSGLVTRVNNWYVYDKQVYEDLKILQNALNTGLDEINDTLLNNGPSAAAVELQSFLKESVARFNRIKVLHAKLEHISKSL